MKKVTLSLLSLLLVFSIMGTAIAKESGEKVVYKAEIKSEEQLIQDAKNGKRDAGLEDIVLQSQVIDGKDGSKLRITNEQGKEEDVKVDTYYTVQKIQEIEKGDEKIEDYLVVALADPTGYDARDNNENAGSNFRQWIWMWASKTTKNGKTYTKATKYQVRYDLLATPVTINQGKLTAKTEGTKLSGGTYFNQTDPNPSVWSNPSFGTYYNKTAPAWDYVLTDGVSVGFTGAVLETNYTIRSTPATLRLTIAIGTT